MYVQYMNALKHGLLSKTVVKAINHFWYAMICVLVKHQDLFATLKCLNNAFRETEVRGGTPF